MYELSMSNTTNTRSARYDPATERLQIVFADGRTVSYCDVPEEVWDDFTKALSKGFFLKENVVGKYREE